MSIAEKLKNNKEDAEFNSIKHYVALDSVKEAQEDLAKQISDANSDDNLDYGEESFTFGVKTREEERLEREIEHYGVRRLLRIIEQKPSREKLLQLLKQYEGLLQSWNKEAAILRSEKHLKEYLAVNAAFTMMRNFLQNQKSAIEVGLLETLRNGLKSQQQLIQNQTRAMREQNNILNQQRQQFTNQLVDVERLLQASRNALRQDQGKLRPEELNRSMNQLNENLRQVQALRDMSNKAGAVDFKSIAQNLQRVQQQQQRLAENSRIGEALVKSVASLGLKLQDFVQQANRLNEISRNNNAQQINQNNVVNLFANNRNNALDGVNKTVQAVTDPVSKGHVCHPGCGHNHNHDHAHGESARKVGGKDPVGRGHVCHAGCGHNHDHAHGESARKVGGKDPVGQGHVCHAGCSHNHDHAHGESARKVGGKDPVSQGHVCHAGCSHNHDHAHGENIRKVGGKDPVSQGHVCHPGCGHNHNHNHAHKDGAGKVAEHTHKEHSGHGHEGPCTSKCSGHGAHASEPGRNKDLMLVRGQVG